MITTWTIRRLHEDNETISGSFLFSDILSVPPIISRKILSRGALHVILKSYRGRNLQNPLASLQPACLTHPMYLAYLFPSDAKPVPQRDHAKLRQDDQNVVVHYMRVLFAQLACFKFECSMRLRLALPLCRPLWVHVDDPRGFLALNCPNDNATAETNRSIQKPILNPVSEVSRFTTRVRIR